MSKSIDLDLLNARLRDAEQVVQQAKFLEEMGLRGDTPEGIIKQAKGFLKLQEGDLVTAEANTVVKKYNVQAKAFLELVAFRSKALEAGLITAEQDKTLEEIENNIATTMSERYDVEVEELYTEEE